jgi:hypothetical protein
MTYSFLKKFFELAKKLSTGSRYFFQSLRPNPRIFCYAVSYKGDCYYIISLQKVFYVKRPALPALLLKTYWLLQSSLKILPLSPTYRSFDIEHTLLVATEVYHTTLVPTYMHT